MILFVSLAFAESTALSDDFEDGSGGSWRPVLGSWSESGGTFNGSQPELGLGAMTYVAHHSLKTDVTFSIGTTGPGLGGVIYAATEGGLVRALRRRWRPVHRKQRQPRAHLAARRSRNGARHLAHAHRRPRSDAHHARWRASHDDRHAVRAHQPRRRCRPDRLPEHGVASFLDFSFSPGGLDADGDGEPDETDCAPEDPAVNPAAEEVWYDGVDQDCDGADDYDQDGDGVTVETDCDDTDRFRYPGKEDLWYDGIDADCGGNDDFDADGDGHALEAAGGDDCNDGDATIFPESTADECDGTDRDCDGFVPSECDDTAADSGEAADDSGGEGGGGGGGDCGCASTGSGGAGVVGAIALLALAGRRRRA